MEPTRPLPSSFSPKNHIYASPMVGVTILSLALSSFLFAIAHSYSLLQSLLLTYSSSSSREDARSHA